MIGLVPPDRWTCPSCQVTEVPRPGSEAAIARALRRAQEQHARDHAVPTEDAAAEVRRD